MRFKALIDFDSPELSSSYVTGLEYTVGPSDARLAELAKRWLMEGKIKVLIGSSSSSAAAGVGLVS